jgi:chromate transporter
MLTNPVRLRRSHYPFTRDSTSHMNEDSVRRTWKAGDDPPPQAVGLLRLFLLFSQLGLSSFGGNVSAWAHRDLVERRRLIGETEFIAALGVCRIMPGASVVNLAVVIGRQLRGAAGASTAALGLLLGPSLLILAFALVYRRFAGAAAFHAVLEGAAAASVGLMIAMGLSIGARLVGFGGHSNRGAAAPAAALAVIAATFVLIGVARFPMVPTVLCLAPVSIGLARFWPASRHAEASDAGG